MCNDFLVRRPHSLQCALEHTLLSDPCKRVLKHFSLDDPSIFDDLRWLIVPILPTDTSVLAPLEVEVEPIHAQPKRKSELKVGPSKKKTLASGGEGGGAASIDVARVPSILELKVGPSKKKTLASGGDGGGAASIGVARIPSLLEVTPRLPRVELPGAGSQQCAVSASRIGSNKDCVTPEKPFTPDKSFTPEATSDFAKRTPDLAVIGSSGAAAVSTLGQQQLGDNSRVGSEPLAAPKIGRNEATAARPLRESLVGSGFGRAPRGPSNSALCTVGAIVIHLAKSGGWLPWRELARDLQVSSTDFAELREWLLAQQLRDHSFTGNHSDWIQCVYFGESNAATATVPKTLVPDEVRLTCIAEL